MKLCGICGGNHFPSDCDTIQVVSHIPDKSIPSKARMTVPECLELRKMADNTYSVMALYSIEKGTQFGPVQAKKAYSLLPTINFPLKVFYKNGEEYCLDTSDENDCNWMMFVNPASDFQEQNLISYQDGEDIYFITVKDIYEGEALKVWYSPYYITKMQKVILKSTVTNKEENLKDDSYIDILVKNKKNITSREMWSCKFCGKMEKNLPQFALHLLQHYIIYFRDKSKRYCQICNMSFLKMRGYQKHMKIVHETDVIVKIPKQSEFQLNALLNSENIQTDSISKDLGGPLLFNDLLNDSMDNTGLMFHSNTDMDLTGIENQSNLFENENLNLNMESILTENVKDLDNFNFEMVLNETEQFVCDICLKTFKNIKAMILHMNIHTGKFPCHECNKVFARKENLQYHVCKAFYKLKCTLCNKLFFQQKYLTHHLKTAHNYNCKTCKQFFESEEQQMKHECSKKEVKNEYPCTQCSKVFTQKNNLLNHVKAHQVTEKINCPLCNKLLNSYKTYLKHYKLHEGHRYKCDICDKVFMRTDSLKAHKDYVHTVSKMETCEVCKKMFKSKKLLKEHMFKIHEGNVFPCQQCSATFKQQYSLRRHVRSNHETNKGIQTIFSNIDKQFSCPKCDKKMKFSQSVKRHIANVHPECKIDYKVVKIKKVECDLCNKVFTNNDSLSSHIERVHLANNTETCEICKKVFKSKKLLKHHMKIHEGNAFVCQYCSARFKQFINLKRHIKTVHPEYEIDERALQIKTAEESVLAREVEDLKQTIENINFTPDEINHEITIEIDKLLNNPDTFTSDSNDRLVESLINTAVNENNLGDTDQQKDVMLSMPDLDLDHISLVNHSKSSINFS